MCYLLLDRKARLLIKFGKLGPNRLSQAKYSPGTGLCHIVNHKWNSTINGRNHDALIQRDYTDHFLLEILANFFRCNRNTFVVAIHYKTYIVARHTNCTE